MGWHVHKNKSLSAFDVIVSLNGGTHGQGGLNASFFFAMDRPKSEFCMNAQLISPMGQILELDEETYYEIRLHLALQTPQREARMTALLALLEEVNQQEDSRWWDDFTQFLAENRLHFPERLVFGEEDSLV